MSNLLYRERHCHWLLFSGCGCDKHVKCTWVLSLGFWIPLGYLPPGYLGNQHSLAGSLAASFEQSEDTEVT